MANYSVPIIFYCSQELVAIPLGESNIPAPAVQDKFSGQMGLFFLQPSYAIIIES